MKKKSILLVSILFFFIVLIFAQTDKIKLGFSGAEILSQSEDCIVLRFYTGQYYFNKVIIEEEEYHQIRLVGEGILQEKGNPELPILNRSLIIPDNKIPFFSISDIEYKDVSIRIVPSKGIIYRNQNPDEIPYTFGKRYQEDSYYPANLISLSDPFIVRDFRGITVETYPMQYNPIKEILRIYTAYTITINFQGIDNRNTLPKKEKRIIGSFDNIYRNLFLNYSQQRYSPIDEYGKILVICPPFFLSTIQPYVDWKRQKGIQTELINLSTIGTTAIAVKNYIQNRYNADPDIAYIQLVGDSDTMYTLTAAGGSSDPSYALVAGNDNYPDMFVGRFSANTVSQLQTQIARSIYYERDISISANWLQKASGIASNEGGGSVGDLGESDQQHIEIIRNNLLNYGYTPIDQFYEANGVTASQLGSAFNQGRGLINYTGHGSYNSWSTTGFNINNVNSLTNVNMLPLIVSVACVNGQFDGRDCFAEAWVRATNNGNPTGAIAFWGSSINQSWNPPMRAQDEVNYLMINELKTTVGSLLYNGACRMIEVYGADGANMYKTWHIFGDASLQFRTKTPQLMNVNHPNQIFIGQNTFSVTTNVQNALVCLSHNNQILGSGYTDVLGNVTLSLNNIPNYNTGLLLTISAFNKVTYQAAINLLAMTSAYIAIEQISYSDGSNNLPDYGETGYLSVQYKNTGSVVSNLFTSTLTTTSSYITILDGIENINSIDVNATSIVNNAFSFLIANNIADQYSNIFMITNTDGLNTWQSSFTLIVNAPVLSLNDMTITEIIGNGNGRFDPGETVRLTINLSNIGHAISPSGQVQISCSNTGINLIEQIKPFYPLSINENINLSFLVQSSTNMVAGSLVSFTFNAIAGAYFTNKTSGIYIGLIMEDFETGNITSLPWITFGDAVWTAVNNSAYAGSYCAQSQDIDDNESTSIQITLQVSLPGTISFYYKISSETSYDFLRFYIDGVQQNAWSGEINWTQAYYNVTAGLKVFKWTYTKDSIISSGSDCAWIDNIIFPTSSTIPLLPPQNLLAIPGNARVQLNWQAPAVGNPIGYNIYRDNTLLTNIPISELSYLDTSVINNVTYSYFVTAIYTNGESPYSNIVSVTPSFNPIQIVTIGTSTASQSYPLDRYYNYSTCEFIYLASEIGMSGTIRKIAFNKASGNDTNAITPVTIYMKNTSASTLSSGTYSLTDYTQVYQGSFPNNATSGWMEVELSNPFSYSNSQNLSILIIKGYQQWITAYPTYYYTSQQYRMRRERSDTAQPTSLTVSPNLPNVRFTIQTTLPSTPLIQITPTSINLNMFPNQLATQTLTLSNTGSAILQWQMNVRSNSFGEKTRPVGWLSPTFASGSINAGSNYVLPLTINTAGLTSGTHAIVLEFSSNASNNPILNISVSVTIPSIPVAPARMVAEFEPMEAALIRYPLGIPYSLVAEMAEDKLVYVVVSNASVQATAHQNFINNGVNTANLRYIIAPTDSYWIRDYGPWFIFEGNNNLGIVDFVYNRPRPNDDAIPAIVANSLNVPCYQMNITHTGGNIMTDGNGVAASTNLVLTENSSMTQSQINTIFQNYLGITDYQLYNDPNGTYINHIDCWAKLLDRDKVLIRSVPISHSQYAQIEAVANQYSSRISCYGTPYRIYRVYTPNNEPYTNSFIFNNKIFVPLMGTINDNAALQTYRNAMPGYEVIGFYAGSNTWESTDAIHCRVNSIPDSQMLFINHIPLSNIQTNRPYSVNVQITNHYPLISDSVYIAWKRFWNSSWCKRKMQNIGGNTWSASLPTFQYGDSLYYYIHISDISGRTANLPLCGKLDPFKTSVESNQELDIAIRIIPNQSALSISWNPVSWARSYKIYSSNDYNGIFNLVAQTDTNTYTQPISNNANRLFFKVVASSEFVRKEEKH